MRTDTLLVELGTEELPPKTLKPLSLAFRDGIVAGLKQRELRYGQVQCFATPRRLAVLIFDVQLKAPEKTIKVLGPPLDRARDEAGNWSLHLSGPSDGDYRHLRQCPESITRQTTQPCRG